MSTFTLTDFMQWSLAMFFALLELSLIALIWIGSKQPASTGTGWSGINLQNLISEANGAASFSRFQFMIFTFVVASVYMVKAFMVVTAGGDLPGIPGDVLGLIGISGGSYLTAKGIEAGTSKPPAESETTASTGRWVR